MFKVTARRLKVFGTLLSMFLGLIVLMQILESEQNETGTSLSSFPSFPVMQSLSAKLLETSIERGEPDDTFIVHIQWLNSGTQKLLLCLPDLRSPSAISFRDDEKQLSLIQGSTGYPAGFVEENDLVVLTPGGAIETTVSIPITSNEDSLFLRHWPLETILRRGEVVVMKISVENLPPSIEVVLSQGNSETLQAFLERCHASLVTDFNVERPIRVP